MQRVGFHGPNDPTLALNFPFKTKIWITMIVYFGTFPGVITPSIISGGLKQIENEFKVSPITIQILITLQLIGYAIGGIFGGPVSEFKGRKIPAFVGGLIGAAFTFGAGASQSFAALAINRFFAGIASSMQVSPFEAMLVDLYTGPTYTFNQTLELGILSMVPSFATAIGYYISLSSLRWRYTQYFPAIWISMSLFFILLIPETYGPYILKRKAQNLRYTTKNLNYRANLELSNFSLKHIVVKYLFRPARFFIFEPLLMAFTLYMGMAYFTLYLSIGGLTLSFQKSRNYSEYQIALVYISYGCGAITGAISGLLYLIPNARREYKRTGTKIYAKHSINLMRVGSVLYPTGLLFTGWFLNDKFHWILPIFGVFMTGAGISISHTFSLVLLSRFYAKYAGSMFAAVQLVRTIFASTGPIIAYPTINNLTVPWGYTLIGILAAAIGLFPWLISNRMEKLVNISKVLKEANADAYIPSED